MQVIPFSIKHTYYGKFNESAVPYAKLSSCVQPPNGKFEKHQPQVLLPPAPLPLPRRGAHRASRRLHRLQLRPQCCDGDRKSGMRVTGRDGRGGGGDVAGGGRAGD